MEETFENIKNTIRKNQRDEIDNLKIIDGIITNLEAINKFDVLNFDISNGRILLKKKIGVNQIGAKIIINDFIKAIYRQGVEDTQKRIKRALDI